MEAALMTLSIKAIFNPSGKPACCDMNSSVIFINTISLDINTLVPFKKNKLHKNKLTYAFTLIQSFNLAG